MNIEDKDHSLYGENFIFLFHRHMELIDQKNWEEFLWCFLRFRNLKYELYILIKKFYVSDK